MADIDLHRDERGMFAAAFTQPLIKTAPRTLQTPQSSGGWWPIIRESFAGAWQQNIEVSLADVLSHPTVFACITLIASDIAKMRLELVREEANDVWATTDNPAFSPILRQPNGYQTTFQFYLQWMISKLVAGNAYTLKQRDQRGVVVSEYVLDPNRVRPLIAPDGSVFYELKLDALATQTEDVLLAPAREIFHDLFNPLFHPLVGISPLYACGIAAMLGLKIQTGSTHFFANGAQPGGILTAPGAISSETATRLQEKWNSNFGGINAGKIAVVGDGLKYEQLSQPADKSQLSEQWLAASQAIAVAFHVPWYLVGGPMPPYNNVQALNVQYYTQCLQPLSTALEQVMDKGLGLSPDKVGGVRLGTQFRIKDLLWMDSATMMDVIAKGVGAGVLAPNEGRADLNLGPVTGGDTPYLQQQNFSLEDLDERSKNPQLMLAPAAAPAPADQQPADAAETDVEDVAASFEGVFEKAMAA